LIGPLCADFSIGFHVSLLIRFCAAPFELSAFSHFHLPAATHDPKPHSAFPFPFPTIHATDQIQKTRSTMNEHERHFGERPTDYVGSSRPSTFLNGGPNSPKKKTSSFMEARRNLGLVMNDNGGAKGKGDDLPKIGMIQLAGSDAGEDKTDHEEEEIIEVEDDSDSGSEESGSSEEEIVEEIIEDSEVTGDGSDDDFEALPPPLAIPNALRPVHLRDPEAPAKATSKHDSSDSDDDSDDSDDSDEEEEKKVVRPPAPVKAPVMEKMKDERPPAPVKAPIMEKMKDERPPAPAKAPVMEKMKDERPPAPATGRSNRPNTTRGYSFEEKPEKPFVAEQEEEIFHRPIAKSNDHALRPNTTRGYSFEETPEKPAGYDDEGGEDNNDRPNIAWEKPDWAKKSSLRATGEGENLKKAGNLAKPITSLSHLKAEGWTEEQQLHETEKAQVPQEAATGEKDYAWEKPDWAKNSKLKGTKNAEKLKSGENLSRPIGGIKPIE
jgi:hypothetical protein